MYSEVLLLAAGGTFDKKYDPKSGEMAFGLESHIDDILEEAQCRFAPRFKLATLMDSLDMHRGDRSRLAEHCIKEKETRIVITHGTDTMYETCEVIASLVKGKTIVLTGALTPWTVKASDAAFNLGTAIAYAQMLPPGVYIAMHGRYFNWDRALKDRDAGGFREIDDRENEDEDTDEEPGSNKASD